MFFYVYAYLRVDGSPYYIGKGSGKRAYDSHHATLKPRDRSRVVFLETNLTEIGALALERRMIKWYGRIDLGTGILRNRTDGGEGTSGRVFSEESKKKMSDAKKGKPSNSPGSTGLIVTPEHRAKISAANKGKPGNRLGIPHTEETRAKMSQSQTGKIIPEETRNKISNSLSGRSISEESKVKMSIAAKNRPPISEETRAKLRLAASKPRGKRKATEVAYSDPDVSV